MAYNLKYTRTQINKVKYDSLKTTYRNILKEINPETVEFLQSLITDKLGTNAQYYKPQILKNITKEYFQNNKTKTAPLTEIIYINGKETSTFEYEVFSNIAISNIN